MSAYRTAAGWVVETLTDDDTIAAAVAGRVYEGLAPADATYPLVTVQPYTDPVDTNYNGSRALTVVDLIVRVWDSSPASKGSSGAVVFGVADRIDALLNGSGNVTRPGGRIADCRRMNELASTEDRTGTIVRAAGGRYQLTVS